MYALYIGLAATAVSYLYLMAVPFYAQQVHQGALADERLYWLAIRQQIRAKPTVQLYLYALLFGVILSVAVLYKPWLAHAPLSLNIVLMACWLGGLGLLARIDRLCFLLPDVLTQLLLWLGLLILPLSALPFAETLWAVAAVYVAGRIMNAVGFFYCGQPLFGLGDVKLVAAVTAWLGASAVLPLLFWACVSCVVLEALRQRRWRPQGACAFGPYLVFASLWVGWVY